ncbi:MAG: anaerobic sulfatase-maturation protein [Bacteroidales bacterium]|nr:anaerobic sulfatase-maturation protein [Bacteroidales bacterium]
MAKPTGSLCNLSCTYCYYLEKDKLYKGHALQMKDETLEVFIKQYIQSQDSKEVNFVWQGGEPTLLGIDFFEKALRFQQKHQSNKKISNAFQTNGTLLNDEWGRFFRKNDFLVGVSVDGPQHVHDFYRKTKSDKPGFNKVMQGVEVLRKHTVDFNTLSVVNRYSQEYPLEVYGFLKDIGSRFMQFLPAVEREKKSANTGGLRLTHPNTKGAQVTKWSVTPMGYGRFLSRIFDEWVTKDVGKYFVQLFDATLANWLGKNPGLCVHKDYCGDAMVIEHNGDVYACDHFVYPDFYRGNIHEGHLKEMYFSGEQVQFGQEKKRNLPKQCMECPVRFACHGDCPKHRFVFVSEDGKPISYLCEGLYHFFNHAKPAMDFMANELKNERPPANVMKRCR